MQEQIYNLEIQNLDHKSLLILVTYLWIKGRAGTARAQK